MRWSAIIVLTMMTTICFGADPTAEEIIKKVEETYKSLKTYRAEGTVTSVSNSGKGTFEMKTSFSIMLKKPNLYVISWTREEPVLFGSMQGGAVWSDGAQPFLYISIAQAYSKIKTDEMALSCATGISQGVAHTIPNLFFPVFGGDASSILKIREPKIEKSEIIGDDDCYVLTGATRVSPKEMFWISKASYMIRKHVQDLSRLDDEEKPPELTDDEIKEAISGMGLEVTEKSIHRMRDTLARADEILERSSRTGTSTEVFVEVSSPELKKSDFTFVLPEGTSCKDSLFGGFEE